MDSCIGIDIGGTHIRIAIVSKEGEILHKVEYYTENDKEKITNVILDNCETMIEIAKKYDLTFDGIGISVAGCIDTDSGEILQAAPFISDLQGVNLKQALKRKFPNLNVQIDNDANCAALAERKYGLLKNENNFIVYALETGVGACAYVDGKQIKYCEPGKFIENVFSGNHFDKEKKKRANIKPVHEMGAYNLGEKITEHIYMLNPTKVVLSGPLSKAEFTQRWVPEGFGDTASKFFKERTELLFSELEHPGLLGASTLILK